MRTLDARPLRAWPALVAAYVLAALALFLAVNLEARASEPTWPGIKKEIATRFPGVASISTEELAAWLGDPSRPQPLLLDVRQRAEYDTSHLPGSVWAETARQQAAALQRLTPGRTVVLYCSVGWRSAQAAERLLRQGHTRVFNLDGSIFQWANEGRPLVNGDNAPTRLVHPYNRTWGRLLDSSRRADAGAR